MISMRVLRVFDIQSFQATSLAQPKTPNKACTRRWGASRAQISSSFLRLIIFLVGRLRRPCPQRSPRKPLARNQQNKFDTILRPGGN